MSMVPLNAEYSTLIDVLLMPIMLQAANDLKAVAKGIS